MPSFSSPLPYRPNRATFWPQSVYNLRVDELPVHASSDTWITETSDFHNTADSGTHVRFTPFGTDDWNNGEQAGYFVDTLPAGTTPDSARRTWTANQPNAQQPGPHIYFSNLRQQGATNVLGNYTPLSVIAQGDKHAVCWSEASRELMEAILYRGDRAECGHQVTWDLDDYECYLGPNGVTKAGATATRIPVAPLFFTYQDLVDCGTTGDLGHMLGFVLKDMRDTYTWPARQTDGTQSTGMPEGAILRLRSDFDDTGMTQPEKAIIRTLKRYGMLLFDRSSFIRLVAPNDPSWPSNLSWGPGKLDITDFDVVDVSSVATGSFTRNYPLDVPNSTSRFGLATTRNITTTFETPASETVGMVREHITAWTSRAEIATRTEANADLYRPTWVSIPMPSWSAVAAGSHDAEIDAILNALVATGTCVWITPSPNPELNLSLGTPAQYRSAMARWITRKVARAAANVQIVPIYSASMWATGSTTNPADYLLTSADFPLIGVDYTATSVSSGFTNQTWTAMTSALATADKDFAISRLSRSGSVTQAQVWEAAQLEALTSGSRLKAVCWDDTTSNLTSTGLTAFLASLQHEDCYRGGVRRGVTAGQVDSFKVTSAATTTPVGAYGPHTLYRKIGAGWQTLRIRRKVNGVWVLQQLRRIGTGNPSDLYTSTYQENY